MISDNNNFFCKWVYLGVAFNEINNHMVFSLFLLLFFFELLSISENLNKISLFL